MPSNAAQLRRWLAMLALALALQAAGLGGAGAQAQGYAAGDPVAAFYRGRNVTLLIGIAVGASYDREARLIARHIGRHVPGNPTLVPQNMVGASGMLMANHLHSTAAQDGTALGMMANTIPMNQAVRLEPVRYDAARFHWLGSVMPPASSAMVVWHASPLQTLQDARTRGGAAGATPKGSLVYTVAALLNDLAGTRFRIVTGYQGIASVYLAMERGEVDAVAVTWSEFKNERAELVAGGRIRVLVQSVRTPELPDVPLLADAITDPADRPVADLLLSGNRIGRPLAMAPGAPPAGVAALRAAFTAMIADPAFVADAQGMRAEIGPIGGAAIAAEVGRILTAPADVAERARRILQ